MTASVTQASGYQHILARVEPPLATLTLNRPQRRNAMSLALMREAIQALEAFAVDPQVRVIILAGSGPAFSAGHDLSEMVGRDDGFYQELFETCTELMRLIHAVPQPVIARVHGVATAAGCQLVATCDLAVAAREAQFATPGVRIGLFCSTPMVAVSRAVGRKRAMEMLLTGTPIDADTACAWGLVNSVVDAASLDRAVHDLAERIAGSSAGIVAIGKRAFWQQIDRSEQDAYAYTQTVMAQNAAARDAQEGIDAFLTKRDPQWSDA